MSTIAGQTRSWPAFSSFLKIRGAEVEVLRQEHKRGYIEYLMNCGSVLSVSEDQHVPHAWNEPGTNPHAVTF